MYHIPPIPTWDALHPLVIHFPIVLLLLSPVFILLGALLKEPLGESYRITGLIILLLGTISLFVATSTGKAAADLAERGGGVDAVLSAHESMAADTRMFFAGLSAILIGMTLLPRILKREETRFSTTLMHMAFLILYSVGVLFLVNTAHAGGRLVHEYGVRALLPAENSSAADEGSNRPVTSADLGEQP
jgi:uncharacterized membrane protein